MMDFLKRRRNVTAKPFEADIIAHDLSEAVLYIAGEARACEMHPMDKRFRDRLNELTQETMPLNCTIKTTWAGVEMLAPVKQFVSWPGGLSGGL
jgi:hypothetical protein